MIIWCDMILYDITWRDMILYDVIWYDICIYSNDVDDSKENAMLAINMSDHLLYQLQQSKL